MDKAEARSGAQVLLTCRMKFAGTPSSPPSVSWYAGDGRQLDSVDKSSVGLRGVQAEADATVELSNVDDRRPFSCVSTLGDVEQRCRVVVQVPRECSVLVCA